MWISAARTHFRGPVIVGKDLLEIGLTINACAASILCRASSRRCVRPPRAAEHTIREAPRTEQRVPRPESTCRFDSGVPRRMGLRVPDQYLPRLQWNGVFKCLAHSRARRHDRRAVAE